jgi:hypothetical protein
MAKIPATLIFLLLFTTGIVSTTAQDGTLPWQVTDAQALPIPGSASPRIFPAPDGTRIAYERIVRLNGQRDFYLCVLDVGEPEAFCTEPPEELSLPRGFEPAPASPLVPFAWSPDGAKLAVVGQPLSTMLATGLWLYDTEADSWQNLTGHDYDGSLAATDDSPGPPPGTTVEVQPAWSPDGDQIAVVRAVIDDSGRFGPAHLTLVDAESGDVRELPPLPAPDDHAAPGAVTSLTWSPNGATLAVSLWNRDSAPDHNGLWLFSPAAGEYEQIITEAKARTAFHEVYAELDLTSIGPVMWSPAESRLLVWAGDPGQQPVAVWPFWIDRESSEMTAVPLPEHPNDTGARRNIRPQQATWSPDGASLLVFALGLHPDEERVPLDPDGGSVRTSVRLVGVVRSSETVLGHLPLGPSAALYFAAWGADGDVVINGYRLRLTADWLLQFADEVLVILEDAQIVIRRDALDVR